MKEVYLTKEGLEELKQKLDFMVTVRRLECAEAIKRAREFGDLSENAEYDAAKQDQGFVETEIKELEDKILHAVIISEGDANEITIGNTVKILFLGDDEDDAMQYRIVGTTEADASNNKISNESPLGKALMGKKENDVVDVPTPNGNIVKYKVISIK